MAVPHRGLHMSVPQAQYAYLARVAEVGYAFCSQ